MVCKSCEQVRAAIGSGGDAGDAAAGDAASAIRRQSEGGEAGTTSHIEASGGSGREAIRSGGDAGEGEGGYPKRGREAIRSEGDALAAYSAYERSRWPAPPKFLLSSSEENSRDSVDWSG
eukprot:923333-Rhodomonas_salina.1